MLVKRLPEDSELYHYGIKGQKWGVRRYQNPDGTLTDSGKNHYAKQQRLKDLNNRRIMTDEELRNNIRRLKMEKEYKDLLEADLHPGKSAVKRALSTCATATLANTASRLVALGINVAITKEISRQKIADFLAPKPGGKKHK
jgi:hypothetical protein